MTSSITDRPCLALDVGGTKIEAAVVWPDGSVTNRQRVPTRVNSEQLFDDVEILLDLVREGESVTVLGVGCGGPMRGYGEAVSPLNIPAWRDFPLLSRLRDATGLEVHIDNDAKALALAEGQFGGAQGVSNYLSMVVSTGVGGGIVLNGRLLDGHNGNAGHIGHVRVIDNGRVCACGSTGCLESEVSGAAIAAITGAPASDADVHVRRRSGELVGQAVSSVAALLDLDRCFVGGSVALGFGEIFFDAANRAVSSHARISHASTLRIEPTALSTRGPLLGAACVGWRGAP